MMMTAKENPTGSSASASSQSNGKNIHWRNLKKYIEKDLLLLFSGRSNEIPMNIHPSISSTFDYRQHPSWHKPMTYANYPISTPLFVNPSSTGASSSSSSVDLSTKSFYPHPSMIHPHFYRRHSMCRHLCIVSFFFFFFLFSWIHTIHTSLSDSNDTFQLSASIDILLRMEFSSVNIIDTNS